VDNLNGVNSTGDCSTAGGQVITLTGREFVAPVLVFVNSLTCVFPEVLSSAQIRCRLPASTGNPSTIRILTNGLATPLFSGLSYRLPTISSLAGCSQVVPSMSLTNCNPTGTIIITINGAGFGPSGAAVLVGKFHCDPLVHVSNMEDVRLLCAISGPFGPNNQVKVFQKSSEGSTNVASISYRVCVPGTFVNGPQCTPCLKGQYSDTTEASCCKHCDRGFFAPNNGSSFWFVLFFVVVFQSKTLFVACLFFFLCFSPA
jgi:hypothetical protein